MSLKKVGNEKEADKDKAEKSISEEVSKSTSRQTFWFLGVLVLILIALFAGFWVNNEAKKFDYLGLTFQKESFGQIPIYTSQVTGYGVNGLPMNFKLALRNDPRKLEAPINGTIRFLKGKPVYLSINSSASLESCGDAVALINFGYFMTGLGFDLKTGAPSQEVANEGNQPLINCENKKDSTVLVLTEGDETKISQMKDNQNCYILSVNNCETIPLMERFEMGTLASVRGKSL